jgi:LPPG:FO 2-phospho-L-lactate transferase
MHIARGELLRQGCRLTGATLELSRRLGVKGRILPMTDTPVRTMIATDAGEIHFQEYWVRHRGSLAVRQVLRRWEEPPRATPEVLEALLSAEAVVIGPSNPITSILPILECEGVREALAKQQVLALSPFIGDTPVSGPAGALMRAWGLEPNSRATRDLYAAFLDRFIQDETDPVEVPGSVRLDTLMTSIEKSARLAAEVLALIRE